MKKCVVIGLIALGGLFLLKKTNFCSYASTLWNKGSHAASRAIPRDFELARVRNEMSRIDGDIRAMLGPIAEKMVQVKRLEREIETARGNLKEDREQLTSLTQDVKAGVSPISYRGQELTTEQAKRKLAHDFTNFKRLDAQLKNKEKLLEAHQNNIRAVQDQLAKLAEQKQVFEIRLAQLEAAERRIEANSVVTPLKVDNTRWADISRTLDEIERRQEEIVTQQELEQKYATQNGTTSAVRPSANLNEIEAFLGLKGTTSAKAETSK
jgi:chromosome segregation ATPase